MAPFANLVTLALLFAAAAPDALALGIPTRPGSLARARAIEDARNLQMKRMEWKRHWSHTYGNPDQPT